jgi:hypothetical protein
MSTDIWAFHNLTSWNVLLNIGTVDTVARWAGLGRTDAAALTHSCVTNVC